MSKIEKGKEKEKAEKLMTMQNPLQEIENNQSLIGMGIETEEHKLMKEIVIDELKRLGYSDIRRRNYQKCLS